MKSEKFLEALGDINERYVEEVRCYKMKKRIGVKWLVAIAACMAIAVSAFPVVKYIEGAAMGSTSQTLSPNLGASGKFTVLEDVTYYENENKIGNHKAEIDLFSNIAISTDNDKVNTKASTDFLGKTWTATYKETKTSDYYNGKEYVYSGKTDGRKVTFKINAATGTCTDFYLTLGESYDESLKELTRDECLAKVTEFLEKRIDDIENYELVAERRLTEKYGYHFRFARIIEGIQTSDTVFVQIRENGEIYAYKERSLGAFKGVDVSSIDMTALNKAVKAKLDGIYGEFDSYDYDTTEMILTKLADGSYVFDYQAEVNVKEKKDSATVRDVCDFVIKIG